MSTKQDLKKLVTQHKEMGDKILNQEPALANQIANLDPSQTKDIQTNLHLLLSTLRDPHTQHKPKALRALANFL